MKLRNGLPSLRRKREARLLFATFTETRDQPGFCLAQFSIQRNHLHLIVEAEDRAALSHALHRLAIRIARRLNRLWRRSGTLWADRYHAHVLRTPREVRHALAYVLLNARRHGVGLRALIDPLSSGAWFDGWQRCTAIVPRDTTLAPVAQAESWLLRKGWRRHGLLAPWEVPGPR